MRVIVLVTQKGGSGKTTLCLNLAVAGEAAGARCLILDLDPQATAEAWYHDREAATPRLVRATAGDLPRALEAARAQGFSHVLVDTPGRDEPSVAAAIRAADFCVVPCRPTPADMKATPATMATIRRLAKPAAFVLTQTPPRGFRIREAEIGLQVLGPVAPVGVVARNAFQDAQGAGLGIVEFEPDGKGAEEIRALWAWLESRLEKIGHEPQAHLA
ncbi:ParA family protein [Marinimicrococcus flavescens]|uniref:ParA family protein n=1 Tax=Marinimicrococcus flavescens TaxID=3031815 RepID=A0AAP3V077_9PROT|nr:ParA family protein [Marinimicrococcus flavescens]